MTIKKLYKYVRDEGGTTVSVSMPTDREFVEMQRVIADKGKVLTLDGVDFFTVLDVDTLENLIEIDAPEIELEEDSED